MGTLTNLADWDAKYRTLFWLLILFAASHAGVSALADLGPPVVYWPCKFLEAVLLFGGLLSAALAGHSASMSKR